MSRCQQVIRMMNALNLENVFDFIATREDVVPPKPDPEIYYLVAEARDVSIEDCLILEKSPAGVRAGLNAGAEVITLVIGITQKAASRWRPPISLYSGQPHQPSTHSGKH